MVPTPGSLAPAFALPDQFGSTVRLVDFVGVSVLLVFYPFSFSGVCTSELDELREQAGSLDELGVRLIACSCDAMFTQRAFAEVGKYDFPLLSDFWPHGVTARAYGVFDPHSGRPERATFLIDQGGVIRWSVVNEPGQARSMGDYLCAIAALPPAPGLAEKARE